MPQVITMATKVTCAHGGTVATVGSPKLTVGGSPVLTRAGVEGKPVAACLTVPTVAPAPVSKLCLTVLSVVPAGEATKLTVGHLPVMLATLAGTTDGMVANVTPQPGLSASSPPDKLTTI